MAENPPLAHILQQPNGEVYGWATNVTLLDLFAGMVAASMTERWTHEVAARESYDLAQALLDERARRLGEDNDGTP